MTHHNYATVFNHAAKRATELQMDVGIEKIREFGKTVFSAKLLPRPENRTGWELRCEVVRPGTPTLLGE